MRSTRRAAIWATGSAEPTLADVVAWDHVYWASGAQMLARGYADGAAVDTWDDETSVLTGMGVPQACDLLQATAGNKPTWRGASAGFNGQPVVEFDGVSDHILTTNNADWNMSSSDGYVVMIARVRAPNSLTIPRYYYGNSDTQAIMDFGDNDFSPDRYRSRGTGNVNHATTVDLNAHLTIVRWTGGGNLWVDGNADASTVIGNVGAITPVLGARWNGGITDFAPVDIAFWAAKETLSSDERDAILALSQTFYGTP